MAGDINALPSKIFFVDMLTRDIELDDAILDLLDNCVDGIVRQLSVTPDEINEATPYDGFWARITATPEEFLIEDNCGGIPRDIAINSAFRLGRPDLDRDKDLATVGMYGIGMKRALFKMGRRSSIISQHKGGTYRVEIPPEWLEDDADWKLDIKDTGDGSESNGTSISITELRSSVSQQFDQKENTFLDDLQERISHLFTIIIKKGFRVYINDSEIKGADLDILVPEAFSDDTAIQPYAYTAHVDGVDIDLVVGFYRELAFDDEIEQERTAKRARGNAGWTVICNDRVVLHRDKSHVTGWGIGNVPSYHPQFRTIAGVVRFTSNESTKLPLNTTKRGLDQGTRVYGHVLKYMMEGMKAFIDFTNRWKGQERESIPEFKELTSKDAIEITKSIPENAWKSIRGAEKTEKRFAPSLPKPPREELKRRIIFYRLKKEIEILGEYYFENRNASPSDVGNHCFEDALEKARGV